MTDELIVCASVYISAVVLGFFLCIQIVFSHIEEHTYYIMHYCCGVNREVYIWYKAEFAYSNWIEERTSIASGLI